MVDNSGLNPYLYFATRLVFTKLSDNSYTSSLEKDEMGNVNADIYFSFEDGVLKQKNQEKVDMNGEILPMEMLGLTNSTGGWIGFGDACMEFAPCDFDMTTLPEGTEVKQMSFCSNLLSSLNGMGCKDARLLDCAEVEDVFYIANPLDVEGSWIKGDIDRNQGTVTFKSQYVGTYKGTHQWFVPAAYTTQFDLWDEEENYGVSYRDYRLTDSYVCRYENGSLISDESLHQSFVISRSSTEVSASGVYADIIVKPYLPKATTPVRPIIVDFEENNGLWGELRFALGHLDSGNVYVNGEELSYVIYADGSATPFEFTTNDYWEIPENMSEIPTDYQHKNDFVVNGPFHTIFWYEEWQYAGVQAIHRFNGEEHHSDIVWTNSEVTGIRQTACDQSRFNGKYLDHGRPVIIRNGEKYSMDGLRRK